MPGTTEGDKGLSSSIVASVSAVSGVGNASKTYLADPAGRPLKKPATASSVGSPAGLMAPDRYEFYTFDETGDLVRRHMTIDEIKSLLAGGDGEVGETPIATFYHGPVPAFSDPVPSAASQSGHDPEDVLEDAVKGVQDVVNNVQNVLKSQLEASKNKLPAYIPAPKPAHAPSPSEAAATWSMILPGIMEAGLPQVNSKRRPAAPTKKPVISTAVKKTAKPRPTIPTPAQSKEEPPVVITQRPTTLTTQQDIVSTVYTLVSSSPALHSSTSLRHTSANNASHPEKTTERTTVSTPRLSTTPYRTTDSITLGHTKPAFTKPSSTKPTYSKPFSNKPIKPIHEPAFVKKPEPQQQTHQVVHYHENPQQSESMVKVVTIQRPDTTSTTFPPFVTFISTELSPSTASPAPFSQLTSAWSARPRPTVTPQPPTTTEMPTSTVTMAVEERQETAATFERDSTSDLEVNSRTTDDDATTIDKILSTTTLSMLAVTKPTQVLVPVTHPSSLLTTDMSDFSTMRSVTDDVHTEQTTKVLPASNGTTNPVSNTAERVSVFYDELTTTGAPREASTDAPSTMWRESTPIPQSPDTTIQDQNYLQQKNNNKGDDKYSFNSVEILDSSNEETTKLYLKISSSENHSSSSFSSFPSSSLSSSPSSSPSTSSSTSSPSTSLPEVSTASESVTSSESITSEDSSEPNPTGTSWATTPVSLGLQSSAHASHASDQSAASTEHKPSTVAMEVTITNSDESESRTEPSSIELVSNEESTHVIEHVTMTATASPSSSKSELSHESSNIESLKVLTTTAAPAPSRDNAIPEIIKKPAEGNRDKTATADKPITAEQLWTRVPVVSQEMENQTEGSVKAGSKHSPSVVTGEDKDTPLHEYHAAPYHSPSAVELHAAPHEHLGLEAATVNIDADIRSFVNLCNELAFQMWMSVKDRSSSTAARSIVMSPFAATSTLAMVFLGARGPTSGQMNDVLRLDDMVSFNPHQVMWNVTEILIQAKIPGVATSALVRELYSDKNKGKLLEFYKERAQQFYDGHVEEISFRQSGDLVRRKTNLLVKRQTRGRVQEYMRGSTLALRPPLAAFGANIFETDCSGASTDGRDGEMHFVVVPSSRQRRLVPVPAAVWRSGFLAGYDPALDATAVAFGNADVAISTVLVLPGQQGHVAPGDGLARLEHRLLESRGPSARWARLLRTLLPRPGLELQVPRFSHRSVLNMSDALRSMGLDELFSSEHADLRGLNGVANDLHLSDVVQLNTFSTCGERAVDSRHHVEFFPNSPLAVTGRRAARARRLRAPVPEEQPVGRDRHSYYARLGDALEDAEAQGASGITSSEEASVAALAERDGRTFQRIADFEDPDLMKVPLALRPRQARVPEAARLRFDRPFLFFVRHNPTGILLHMGRFNPRLLP